MADLKNDRRFANLNRLSTEQLEELLRTAPLLPDSQETSDYYDAIEEVILQRETEHPTGRIQDVDSAWAEFQEQFLSSTGESARLYPEERSEMSTFSVKTNKSHAKNIFRKVVPIAATIAVVFMSMIVAQAAGVDIFGSLARWTEETFHFNGGDSTPAADGTRPQVEDETYLAIQAEVDKLGIDVPVVPTWFPDGYELQEIQLPDPDITAWKDINCCFKNKDSQTFFLNIARYEEDYDISSIVFEKDGQQVTEYLGGDKLFYIMSNNSRRTATWSDGHIVVSFNGELSEDTIKIIIDSIGG
jgi:hypothetical protein